MRALSFKVKTRNPKLAYSNNEKSKRCYLSMGFKTCQTVSATIF